MKKTLMGSLVLLTAAWMLQSCESTPEAINLDAQNVSVVGANETQLTVVPEIYQLTQRETSTGSGMWQLNLRVKLNCGTAPLEVTATPKLELLDEMDAPVCALKLGENAMDTKAQKDFEAFAQKTDNTEQAFAFFLNLTSPEEVANIMQKTKNFQLLVGDEVVETYVTDTPDASDDDSASQPAGIEAILPSNLQGKVEVVSVDGVSVDEHAYPEISVTFKLLQTVNTAPLASQYGQLWIVGVAQDASGRDVSELLPSYKQWRSGDSDGSEFKQFLEDAPGNTITLYFTGDNGLDPLENDADKIDTEKQRVSAAAEKVAKFKLKVVND